MVEVLFARRLLMRGCYFFSDSHRITDYFWWRGWSKLVSASGEMYVWRKLMYAISLYGYHVCFYGGSREQIDILFRETSRSLALYLWTICFAFQARTSVVVSTIATVLGVGERFLLMRVTFLFHFKCLWFRSRSWVLSLACHCRYWMVNCQGGYSFSLFNH